MHLLITGARGFIGSAFLRYWAKQYVGQPLITHITAFARNTNDWSKPRLHTHYTNTAIQNGYLKLIYGDLNGDISGICEGIDAVVHFAAKTFVDHSIRDPMPFVESNTIGTAKLLEEARRQKVKAFITISTDEVYGQILTGAYTEKAALNPRNPYAASKAGADCLTISYAHTFGMWTAVTRTENNYGPYQHPQKAIPLFIAKALADENIPIYGDGLHIRQWLEVTDHVRALNHILANYEQMPSGDVWHIAGSQELTNTELAITICDILSKPHSLLTYINEMNIRPGHDRRYALNCDKLKETGWAPQIDLKTGLTDAVEWYKNNLNWLGILKKD